MAKPKTSAHTGKHPGGRPPNPHKPELPPVTGVRLPPDLRATLDAIVDEENRRLAPMGSRATLISVIVTLLREAVAARSKNSTEGGAS